MHQSVRDAFFAFNEPFEGVVHWMYLDVKGLVTIGLGNLIDPVQHAINLPFEYDGEPGSQASQEEIIAAWTTVKSRQDLSGRHREFEALNNLRLSSDAIAVLVDRRLLEQEAFLMQNHFSNFENWTADAQLGCLSMSWAMGANFPAFFPKFKQACLNEDWVVAESECTINEAGTFIQRRNEANYTLFSNAARVMEQGLDLSVLNYPTVLLAEIVITPTE